MEITEKLLAAGASERGGFSKRQAALLDLPWPLPSGWKTGIIGKIISDENAEEFVRQAGYPLVEKQARRAAPINWFGAPEPVDIYLYVHALEGGCFYVGLTADVETRTHQHFTGEGAEWTKLHRPIKILHCVCTGTTNPREAEHMENEVTITFMLRYGIDKVRDGHFCHVKQEVVEATLRSRGVWDRINQAEFARQAFDTEASWSDALDNFLATALNYYDAGAQADQREAVFAACYKLTRYRYWHEGFVPGLNWQFWNHKGILPVLLSFKHARTVGSRLATSYDVLAAALNRGQNGKHPLRRLFLLAWKTYLPPTTENQDTSVERYMEYLNDGTGSDRQYDAFISVLFPETRHLLRL